MQINQSYLATFYLAVIYLLAAQVLIICAFARGLMEPCPAPVAINACVGVNSSVVLS